MSNRSRLLTSTEAAEVLGASTTSVKRWADEGLLPCVRTAGRHRRFTLEDLERFARDRMGSGGGGADGDLDLGEWVRDLTENRPYRVQARIYEARSDLGSWRAVCNRIGRVIEEIGAAWADGRISVAQEHVASEQLARALARVTDTVPLPPHAPAALLATLEGEDHTLGLSLVELALRELGWASVWLGRRTPIAELGPALEQHDVEMLAVSASLHAADAGLLTEQARRLEALCRPREVALLLGGRGAWPDPPPYGRVVRDFRDLARAVPARERLRP
ncbi:MAG: helix-turn-helix domain-containing protein [Sandaracinaceae bacterium]